MLKVALILFGILASASAICDSFNGVDVNGMCACFSGYTGSSCENDVSGSCVFPTVAPLNTSVVAELLNLMVANSYFTFDVSSEGKVGRYFEEISISGNSSCSYPTSSDISHSFDLDSCSDIYSANFSIVDLVGCGFSTNENGANLLIGGGIQVSAVDDLGLFRTVRLYRTTRSVLNVEISIPTFVTVNTTEPLTVYTEINPTYAITSQIYDDIAKTVTVVLTSSVQWPYTLSVASVTGPAPVASFGTTDNTNGCDANTGVCFQDTTVVFDNMDSQCSIDGAFTFQWTYGCREGEQNCPASGIESAVANIETGDTCATVTVVAHISGGLQSYSDAGFSTTQLVFVAGQTMFFMASFTSDVTIQSSALMTLVVKISDQTLELVTDGTTTALGDAAAYSGDNNGGAEYGFSFDAVTGPGGNVIFDTSQNADAVFTFTVEATFSITYKTTFGRKRDIVTESFTFSQRGVLDATSIARSVLNENEVNSGFKATAAMVPVVFAAAGVAANL